MKRYSTVTLDVSPKNPISTKNPSIHLSSGKGLKRLAELPTVGVSHGFGGRQDHLELLSTALKCMAHPTNVNLALSILRNYPRELILFT